MPVACHPRFFFLHAATKLTANTQNSIVVTRQDPTTTMSTSDIRQIKGSGSDDSCTSSLMSLGSADSLDTLVEPQHHCAACPFCADTCGDPSCRSCQGKAKPVSNSRSFSFFGPKAENYYTICQVRKHCTLDSAWLVVGDTIYDATSYISKHPGGERSILKKSGGASDCLVDYNFHSRNAKHLWKEHRVGRLKACPRKAGGPCGEAGQCTIS